MALNFSDKWDFTFAYDVKDFSDRLLRIEIWDGVPKNKLEEEEGCIILISKRKKKKRKYAKMENALDAHSNSEEQNDNCNMPKQNTNRFVGYDDDDEMEEAVETIDEDSFESNSNGSSIICVKSIHINSHILAAKSVLFSELFSNETRGSEHRNVTIRIHVSEQIVLMHLLSFMYSNTISESISPYGLMKVIMVADKYKVSSCMKYCTKVLQSFEMTPKSAVTYINLLFTVRMVEAVQPLVDAAKQYLTSYFENFEKLQELMKLPLIGIEVVLSSNDLQIPNEDTIFQFLIKWAASQYPEPDKRRNIMSTRLSKLMRFHYMSCKTLRKVLVCPDFDASVSNKLVLDALFYQAESSDNQRALIASGDFSIKRVYIIQFPSRIVEFQFPRPRCIVYVDLKMEECIQLSRTRNGIFQVFNLDGEGFFLNMRYNLDPQTGYQAFGLILSMRNKFVGSTPIRVYVKFSTMQKPKEEFISRSKGNFIFDGGTQVGNRYLFTMPWTNLMAEDCVYFIDGSLHFMVELIVIK